MEGEQTWRCPRCTVTHEVVDCLSETHGSISLCTECRLRFHHGKRQAGALTVTMRSTVAELDAIGVTL